MPQAAPDRYDAIVAQFPPAARVLSTMLLRQAEKYAARPLFVFGRETWSYTEAARIAGRAAASLREAGIGPGDRVAMLCGNRPELLQAYLGCAWLGAIAVPINIAARGAQLAHVLRNAAPGLLLAEPALAPALAAIDPALLPARMFRIGAGDVPWPQWELAAEPLPPPPVRPGDTVAILYTSGTTGPAKGVCCPQAQLFWWGIYSARALGIVEGDVLLTTLPLFHTNALNAFHQALLNGCTYVLEPKFSASGFWPAIRRHNATVSYLLGAMAAILLGQPATPADTQHILRVALGGGVPARLHAPFTQRFGVPLVDGYASTETNFVFAGSIPSDDPGGMGYLARGAQARIVDDNDTELPDGQSGELILRADEPFAFAQGYYAMPEKTVEAWRNLWFHTGDRVLRQPDGHYRFIDRMKDSIRRRGENISSFEVEQVLALHAAILTCAVYPLPSELGEDEVAAAIQLRPGAQLAPEDIMRHCQGRLAHFAIPRFIRFVDSMPLTENGKIRKTVLREAGRGAAWDREAAGYRVQR